jgi:hypothetical protein
VLEPRSEFTDRDAEALYEYVKRGGCLFINYTWGGVVDEDWNPTGGKLGALLGYELSRAPVLHLMQDVTGGKAGGAGIAGPGVEQVQVYGNPKHPVTRRFVTGGRSLEVKDARAVREGTNAPAGMRREELLQTGEQGWLGVPGADGHPLLFPPQGMRTQGFTVGLTIELDAEASSPGTPDALPRTGRVAIVSGAFCNNARVQQSGDLAFNICNWMAERRVLLDIHGSRYEVRSLQLNQQQLDRIWLFMFYGVPGTFFVLGSLVIWLRRRP